MTRQEYRDLVIQTARQFVDEQREDRAAEPDIALMERTDAIADAHFSDEDAVHVLQFSSHPRAHDHHYGWIHPDSDSGPYPFKDHAAAAFEYDVRDRVEAFGFVWDLSEAA